MTLNFVNSISPTSVTFRYGCTAETLNQVLFIETTSNTLRRYDLTSLAQVGTNLTVASTPVAVIMVDQASAMVVGTGSSAQLIELSTEYIQSYSGGTTQLSNQKSQQAAADTSAKIAFFCLNFTNRSLMKFDANTFTLSNISYLDLGNDEAFGHIIYKSSGRFLAAGNRGKVFEIDTTGKILQRYEFSKGVDSQSSEAIDILAMSYSYGFLTVMLNTGNLEVLDWTTKTTVHKQFIGSGNGGATPGNSLCEASSGVCIMDHRGGSSNFSGAILELDFTRGLKVGGVLTTATVTGSLIGMGINSTNAKGWAMHSQGSNNRIHVFNVVPRTTVERVFSSPGNANFRLIVIDETAGQGHLTRVIDTYTTSPRTLLLETGKSYLELIKVGDGTDATWDVSRYSL